jgi:hypothetical protein
MKVPAFFWIPALILLGGYLFGVWQASSPSVVRLQVEFLEGAREGVVEPAPELVEEIDE